MRWGGREGTDTATTKWKNSENGQKTIRDSITINCLGSDFIINNLKEKAQKIEMAKKGETYSDEK